MILTPLQMAAALCEQVYRRDNAQQQLDKADAASSATDLFGGFGADLTIATESANGVIAGLKESGGFFYDNYTGFVGQIVRAGA